MNKPETNYQFVIKEIKDNEAILSDSKVKFSLPAQLLPRDSKAGETIVLTLLSLEDYTLKEEKTAKEILNEILKDKNSLLSCLVSYEILNGS